MGYFDPEIHNMSKGELGILPGRDFQWPGITSLVKNNIQASVS